MARLKNVLRRAGLLARPRDVLVTGLPRSGTTLTCHLLQKLPDTVALHEPMDFHHLGEGRTLDDICGDVERFLKKQRRSIVERGVAVSKHAGGKVPDNSVGAVRDAAGKRTNAGMDKGEIRIDKELPPDFMLVVKHASSFTALLPALVRRWQVFAVVRNPLSILASWNSISLVVGTGRIPAAERVDDRLRAELDAIDDVAARQIHLLGWFFSHYRDHLPAGHLVRYEDIVATHGKALRVVNPLAERLDEPLESRNRNQLYDGEAMQTLGRRLLATEGAYWEFYSRASVEELLR